jgi:hypothetical protein
MRNTFRYCALIAGLALAGCSTYQKRWDAARIAAYRPEAVHAGAYEGRWESTRMPGTGGNLWCILTPDGQGNYTADFKATWHGVFKSEHGALLKTGSSRKPGHTTFSGEAALTAIIGSGKYTCTGELTPGGMTAAYDASYDVGNFTLKRAAAAK